MNFFLGYALGKASKSRHTGDDGSEIVAMIFVVLILIAVVAAVAYCPIAMIIAATKLFSGNVELFMDQAFVFPALAVGICLFLGWLSLSIVIPNAIAPAPYEGSRFFSREENYDEKKRKHTIVSLIAFPISIAVGFGIGFMAYSVYTCIAAGSLVTAGVLCIILSVLAIPFGVASFFSFIN